MKFGILSIKLPEKIDLSQEQITLINEYIRRFKEINFSEHLDHTLISYGVNLLNNFYNKFKNKLQHKYEYWYKYQITLIDPLTSATAKVKELINKTSINHREANISVKAEDDNIFIACEDEFASIKLLKIFNQEFEDLKYRTVKINVTRK